MSTKPKTITIDDVEYVRKSDASVPGPDTIEGYAVVRCDRSGVFAGTVVSRDGREAVMANVRCLWYWDGAAALPQLAVDGVSKPENCKFTVRLPHLELTDVISVMPCTKKAFNSIEGVKEWKK